MSIIVSLLAKYVALADAIGPIVGFGELDKTQF